MPSLSSIVIPSNYHNNAGIYLLKIAPTNYFTSENTFASGKTWIDVQSTLNASGLEINPQEDDNGIYYESKATGFYPTKDETVENSLNLLSKVGIVCIAIDRDGNNRKLGSLEEPAEFRITQFATRGRPGTAEGYRYELNATSRYNPPVFIF